MIIFKACLLIDALSYTLNDTTVKKNIKYIKIQTLHFNKIQIPQPALANKIRAI